MSKIATPYNPNQGTNWLQNVFSPLTVREPYRLSLSKKTELWYGGGEEGTPWEDVNSRWPPHLLGETVGVLPHNRYPCPEAKQTGRWLQRRHSEDTGPFSSATHTATSFQPGVFLLLADESRSCVCSYVPRCWAEKLSRAWRAQCTQHYGNNHHGASDLSLTANQTKEGHHSFTDRETEPWAGRWPPLRYSMTPCTRYKSPEADDKPLHSIHSCLGSHCIHACIPLTVQQRCVQGPPGSTALGVRW